MDSSFSHSGNEKDPGTESYFSLLLNRLIKGSCASSGVGTIKWGKAWEALDACEAWVYIAYIKIVMCVLVCAHLVCLCFQTLPSSDRVLNVALGPWPDTWFPSV